MNPYRSIRIVSMEGGVFEATQRTPEDPWIVRHSEGGFVFWGDLEDLRETIYTVIELLHNSHA
jgi:hypothetical protein